MNEMVLFWVLFWMDLERAMKKALTSGLLLAAAVFMASVLFGWPYALMMGLIIIGLVTLLAGRKA